MAVIFFGYNSVAKTVHCVLLVSTYGTWIVLSEVIGMQSFLLWLCFAMPPANRQNRILRLSMGPWLLRVT
jgi:hypothetical protein